jgi:hypothetical protein
VICTRRGHPLGLNANRKNVALPVFYLLRLFCGCRNAFCSSAVTRSPSFRWFDSRPFLSSLATGGDPFSHPSGSSAVEPYLNRREPMPCGSGLSPARFVGTFRLLQRVPQSKPRLGVLRPIPVVPGSRKLSVPGRVHSVQRVYGFLRRGKPSPKSNPFVTHGTVESSANLFYSCFHKSKKERTAAFQSVTS